MSGFMGFARLEGIGNDHKTGDKQDPRKNEEEDHIIDQAREKGLHDGSPPITGIHPTKRNRQIDARGNEHEMLQKVH